MSTTKQMLDNEIQAELENLKQLEPGTEEHERAVTALSTLYRAKNDEDRGLMDRIVKIVIDGAGIALPLAFYAAYFKAGLTFEKYGIVTSPTVKGLIRNFKPTRR